MQTMSCLNALKTLAKQEHITLPAAVAISSRPKARLLSDPAPIEVPDGIDSIKGLRIVRVETRDDLALWNTLVHHEHVRGVTKFVGYQKKYLFSSDHGYLGGIGFVTPLCIYPPEINGWVGRSLNEMRTDRM